MAHFIRGTQGEDKEKTPLKHSKDIAHEYLRLGKMAPFKGMPGSGKPIVMRSDFVEGGGDNQRFHFIPQNRTDGIYGQNATILGNEESLDDYYMDLKVDVVAKAFKKKGVMTDIRTIWNFREQSKDQLVNWFALQDDIWTIDALTGRLTNGFDYIADSAENTTVYTNGSARVLLARDGSAEIVADADLTKTTNTLLTTAATTGLGMDTSNKMNSYVLDEVSVMTADGMSKYNLEPIKVENGDEYYILLIDKISRRDLRQDSRFEQHMISVLEAGLGEDPIATGAMGVWDNVIIKCIDGLYRWEDPNNAGDYYTRNLLLGSNALGIGYAMEMDYTEELEDHDRLLSVAGSEVRGQTKVTFDGVDMGVAQVICNTNA